MTTFMNQDFLLKTEAAKKLYHDHAAKMPIIDYHCHINPMEIYEDKRYNTITEVWLGGDHYKWRAMRSCGVAEKYITGDATPAEKFQKWGEAMPMLIGNPLYHWTHLELQRYFGITEPLTGENAMEIYEKCNAILAQPDMSVRGIIRKSGVKLICTTDDPVDDLKAHELLAKDTALLDAIDGRFPGCVEDGKLNRKALAAIVFSDPSALADLNTITHSAVKAEVLRHLGSGNKLIAIDAIGLFEGGLAELCDATVAITAPLEARVQRLIARDNITEEQATLRINAQKPESWFRENCDFTLENNGSANNFQEKCLAFFRKLSIIKEKA